MVQLTSDWKRYESAVKKAIHSVIKVSDALTINAKRASKHAISGAVDGGDRGTLFLFTEILSMTAVMAMLGSFQGI